MMKKFIFLIVALFFLLQILYAKVFVPVPDQGICMTELRTMYKKLVGANVKHIETGQVYYIDYDVKVATTDSVSEGIIETPVQMWMTKNRMEIKSKEVEIFQDEKDVFTILLQKKTIVRSDAYLNPHMEDKKARIEMFQDTLLSLSTVTACEEIIKNGKRTKRMVLSVTPTGQKLLGVKKLIMLIDPVKKQFETVHVDYVNADNTGGFKGIVYAEYHFNEISYDYKLKKLDGNIAHEFMANSTTLIPKYRSYKYMDVRYKESPKHTK